MMPQSRERQTLGESNPVFVPAAGKTELVWNGTVGSDASWNPITPVAGEECNFILSGLGGCYGISGVDWSAYDSPVLTLHSETLNGSFGYELTTTANTTNPYWTYIESSEIKGTWATSSDKEIDLSALELTGSETVYIRLNGVNAEGNVTLTVSDKK